MNISRQKRLVVTVVGIFASVLMAIQVLPWVGDQFGFPFANPFDDRRFEQSVWLADSKNRGPMVIDLLKKLRRGITRQEVERLLGKPDGDGLGVPVREPDGITVNYYLGAWSGMRIDGDYLSIRYDNSGRLVEAYCWQS